MGLGRALLCILLPPLAVLDKGCGSILIVTLLTLVGWVPSVIAAKATFAFTDASIRRRFTPIG